MRFFRSFVALFLGLFLTGCEINKNEKIVLNSWRYQDGIEMDNNGNFVSHRLKVTQLHDLASITPGRKGFITISSEFSVPRQLQYRELGLFIGKTQIAAKVYLNGVELEQIGIMPPDAFSPGTNTHAISISRDLIKNDQRNRIDIMIWVDGAGGVSGIPYIGLQDDVQKEEKIRSFYMSELTLLFAGIMFLVGLYYLILFFTQRKNKPFLYFGLMNLTTMLFILPFFIGEFPWLMGFMNLNSFKKLFEGIMGVLTSFFAVSFFRASINAAYNRKYFALRAIVLGISIVSIIIIPDSVTYYEKHYLIFTVISMQVIFLIPPIIKHWKEKKWFFIKYILPFIPTYIAISIDFIIMERYVTLIVPLFTVYGWALTDVVFLIVLACRYAAIQNRMDELNSELESKVEQRTKELEAANMELAYKNHQAEQDLELAVHMQQEFYKNQNAFLGWDVAVHFQPMSGVSGDLYDFYAMDGKLRGFGLFDVSGHGISSGLVTMLAKNAIFHEFRASLPLELSQAIIKVNDAIIRVKGEIDNYMTGILCRIDRDDSSKLELVNAGCPYPILKKLNSEVVKFIEPDPDKEQYGMLGLKHLALNCQTIPVTLDDGDCIILFTDGLNEAVDKNGEEYGKERILESIKNTSGTAQEILNSILADYNRFVEGGQIKDDLTVVVVQRASHFEEAVGELEELE